MVNSGDRLAKIINPSSYCFISSAANAFYWPWQKTTHGLAFVFYCSEIICPSEFTRAWFSKVLLLEINFSMKQRKKTTSKKTSWTAKQSQPKIKQNACFIFAFLSKHASKNNRIPALVFVFETSNPEVVSCTNEKVFFSLYFFFTRKQSFQQTNYVFCEQNLFVHSLPFANQAKQKKKRAFTKVATQKVRTAHSCFLMLEKLF